MMGLEPEFSGRAVNVHHLGFNFPAPYCDFCWLEQYNQTRSPWYLCKNIYNISFSFILSCITAFTMYQQLLCCPKDKIF